MIRSVQGLKGHAIHATDGNLGKAADFYFDDQTWTLRYIVVETGNWLTDKSVLISPAAVRNADWEGHRIDVALTRAQVENSPDIDTAKPVSRQHEAELALYYGWPYYWGTSGVWAPGMVPGGMAPMNPIPPLPTTQPQGQKDSTDDPHLRSTNEVIGYRIHAHDGDVGHVHDFLFDDESWRLLRVVAELSNWLPGRKVLIDQTLILGVDWAEQQMRVDLTREQIKARPNFDWATYKQGE